MKPHFRFRQGGWAVYGPVFTGTGQTPAEAWADYCFWRSLAELNNDMYSSKPVLSACSMFGRPWR